MSTSSLPAQERAQLAMRLAAARKGAPAFNADPEHRFEPFALNDIQQAYFIGRQGGMELGNIACHSYHEVDVVGWDPSRLQTALDALVVRHEMLRAVVLPDGQQVILKAAPAVPLEIVDLRGQDEQRARGALLEIRERLSHRVQPTDRWPLWHVCLARCSSSRARLFISVDLLIADGRSLEILFDELGRLMRDPGVALPALPPLELSFRDYLAAGAASAAGNGAPAEALRRARAYWLERIPTLPPAPELPLARAMASIEHPHFVRRTLHLEADRWTRLRQRAAARGVTPSGLLLAAYAEILALHSRSARFTLNLTLFNRLPLHPQAADIIGDFTSLDLLEIDAGGDQPFEARAARQRQRLWQDLDHRAFSGIQVLREMARFHGGGPRALMPVVFSSLLNLDGGDGTAWPYRLGEPVFGLTQTPQVALDCIVQQARGGALLVSWDAVDDLFPPGLLDDMQAMMARLLDELAEDDAAWQRTLRGNAEHLLPAAQARARQEANATSAPLSDELLHLPFLAQVSQRSGHLAVCTPSRRLTYGEIYARAATIEEALLERMVRPNQLVAVLLPKGWEQVVAVLGIHLAGAAYLPIDSELPAERQRWLLEHGEVPVVLTSQALLPDLPLPPGVVALAVDGEELAPAGAASLPSPTHPRRRQRPTDLAYVIYTSGSTGLPKGVMIDHRGALNTVLDINRRFGVGPDDRVLALSRLNFDLSVYDVFGLLAAGGTVVFPEASSALDPVHWLEQVQKERVTLWNTVPALMQLFTEQIPEGSTVDSLRLVMMSGDWIPLALPPQIRRTCPRAAQISMGGATEASIWSILHPIEKLDPDARSVPYGRPMDNQGFHVLNRDLGPCPSWVPGELYISGVGLAQGYWRDPERTAQSFITHPGTGERLYRTGDLGRYLPGATIEFLGREDSQVKVNGHRIELGEIEHHLTAHPDVEQAVVVVQGEPPGPRRLAGYVVLRQPVPPDGTSAGAAPSPGAAPPTTTAVVLRQHLSAHLPAHMVPGTLMVLERLPLSANGKVDRRALPVADAGHGAPATREPRDPLELQLVRLWEEHLAVRPIGIDDSFFDLGGTSLLAVRLFAQIHRQFGKMLPLSALIRRPTIEHLATLLRAPGQAEAWTQLVPVRTAGSRPPLFCVHGHMGNALFYRELAQHLGPDQPFYAFQARGTVGDDPHASIEEMATAYVAELRTVQPHGPYHIGGYCFGGRVAAEMACQLRAAGEEVALLAVMALHEKAAGVRWRMHTERLARLPWVGRVGYLGSKALKLLSNLGVSLRQRAWCEAYRYHHDRRLPLPSWMTRDLPMLHLTFAAGYTTAYQPGRVTILLHGEVPEDFQPDLAAGYAGYRADQLDVDVVVRSAEDYFKEPLVVELAKKLSAALARTTAATEKAAGPAPAAAPGELVYVAVGG
jgi:amino acid adenylation domain-containing protein